MVFPMPSTSTPGRIWVAKIDPLALQQAMARKGYTQRRLIRECATLGTTIDPGNLYRAMTGQPGAIGIAKLPAMAEALGVDPAGLLTDFGKAVASGKTGQPT